MPLMNKVLTEEHEGVWGAGNVLLAGPAASAAAGTRRSRCVCERGELVGFFDGIAPVVGAAISTGG